MGKLRVRGSDPTSWQMCLSLLQTPSIHFLSCPQIASAVRVPGPKQRASDRCWGLRGLLTRTAKARGISTGLLRDSVLDRLRPKPGHKKCLQSPLLRHDLYAIKCTHLKDTGYGLLTHIHSYKQHHEARQRVFSPQRLPLCLFAIISPPPPTPDRSSAIIDQLFLFLSFL